MTDKTDTPIPGEPAKPKPTMTPLRERASKTAKMLWTGVGALATMGGVLGLIQVLSANNSGSLKAGASSQDVLMEMVKSGDIEVADAERLAELLYGEDGQADTEGLKDIVEGGTDRQKKAIALGQKLDREGKLTTPYQPILSYLIATRDGTLPDYEAAQSE